MCWTGASVGGIIVGVAANTADVVLVVVALVLDCDASAVILALLMTGCGKPWIVVVVGCEATPLTTGVGGTILTVEACTCGCDDCVCTSGPLGDGVTCCCCCCCC
jgi:hypothetical protein